MAFKNTRHRTFGSHNKKASKVPVTFDLLGTNEETGENFTETFTARAKVPGMTILEFAAAGSSDGNQSIAAVYEFYSKALSEEEYARFMAFVEDPRYDIELDTLVEVIGYLIEEYASRPTEAP